MFQYEKNAWRYSGVIFIAMDYLVPNVMKVSHVQLNIPPVRGSQIFFLSLLLEQSPPPKEQLVPNTRLSKSSQWIKLARCMVSKDYNLYSRPSINADTQSFVWMFTVYALHKRLYATPLLWLRERNCVPRMRDNLLQSPKTAGYRSFSLSLPAVISPRQTWLCVRRCYETNNIFRDSQFKYLTIICKSSISLA